MRRLERATGVRFDTGAAMGAMMQRNVSRRSLAGALAMVALLPFAASRAWAFPWSIDMFRGAAVQPLSVSPRVTPEGALPRTGELPISRGDAANLLHNPLTATRARLRHGKELFDINCAVCHGAGGKGDGPVAYRFADTASPVANLVTDAAVQADGYFYATIRDGGELMPSYADAMSAEERWEVVLFLRYLEGKLPPLGRK